MSFIKNIRRSIRGGGRVLIITGGSLLFVILVAYLAYYRFTIYPNLALREELISQVTLARSEAIKAELEMASRSPELIQDQIDAIKLKLDRLAAGFLSESEAASVLDNIYQYSSESNATIRKLESQPSLVAAPEPAAEGAAPAEGEAASAESTAAKTASYDARVFNLEVEGTFEELMRFVVLMEEASSTSVQLRNLNIAEVEQEPHALIMDVAIYTSPFALAEAAQAQSEQLSSLYESLGAAWNAGQWVRAISVIGQLMMIRPADAALNEQLYAARLNLGYDYLGRGEPDSAAAQFELALQAKPDGQEALAALEQLTPTPEGQVPATATLPAPAGPTATPHPDPTAHPYLVRPDDWPADLPWPPTKQ